MMNDSVREELEAKITSGGLRPTPPAIEAKPLEMKFVDEPPRFKKAPVVRESPNVHIAPTPVVKRVETADLRTPKTSPTLVDFQTQKATLPDWRLQIQNAVQQRVGAAAKTETTNAAVAATKPQAVKTSPTIEISEDADPRVAAAMQRVNESRKAFGPKTAAERMAAINPVPPIEARPFNIVPPKPFTSVAKSTSLPKPNPPAHGNAGVSSSAGSIAATAPARAIKVDTNKLPKLATIVEPEEDAVSKALPSIRLVENPIIAKAERLPEPVGEPGQMEFAEIGRIRIKAEHLEIEAAETIDPDTHDIEDIAPISMRFGAGLFDLIIGGFASMLLLSPVAFSGSNWLTPVGGLTFAGVWAAVIFIYMTASLAFYGKTLGMRLFSLELVDAVENEYPTMQQAAVNSALFLLMLPIAGAGFVTLFFNEENRAVHDLLSGTILVREF